MYELFIWCDGEWEHLGSSPIREAVVMASLLASLNGEYVEVMGW